MSTVVKRWTSHNASTVPEIEGKKAERKRQKKKKRIEEEEKKKHREQEKERESLEEAERKRKEKEMLEKAKIVTKEIERLEEEKRKREERERLEEIAVKTAEVIEPLGMENLHIPDACITASSSTILEPPHFARLNSKKAWCAGKFDDKTSNKNSYLQVDLGSLHRLYGVATQGNYYGNLDYVKRYKLHHSTDGLNWTVYKENGNDIIEGNTDNWTVKKKDLEQEVITRFVRFYPIEWYYWPCLCVELYGVTLNAKEEQRQKERTLVEAERKSRLEEEAERKRKLDEEAEENESWRKKQNENKRKLAEKAERKRKLEEEAERKRKLDEEAERKRKLAEKAERKRKVEEEAERKRKLEEKAERKRKVEEEAERKRKLDEEAERKRKLEEEAERKRKLEEGAERKRKLAEEAERKQKLKEDAERKQKLEEDAERKRKLEEEAERKLRLDGLDEEAERKQKLEEDAERKQKLEEEAERKRRLDEEAERKQKLEEDAERKRKLEEEQKGKEQEQHCVHLIPVNPAAKSAQESSFFSKFDDNEPNLRPFPSWYGGLNTGSLSHLYSPANPIRDSEIDVNCGSSSSQARRRGGSRGSNEPPWEPPCDLVIPVQTEVEQAQIVEPLGMENRNIPNACITASSSTILEPPHFARLNSKKAWCAGKFDDKTSNKNSYLQVDLGSPHRLCSVATLGNYYGNLDYVKRYKLHHSTDGFNWTVYKENGNDIIEGNADNWTVKKKDLEHKVIARFVRFYPIEWYYWPCMSVELYGVALYGKNQLTSFAEIYRPKRQ